MLFIVLNLDLKKVSKREGGRERLADALKENPPVLTSCNQTTSCNGKKDYLR